MKILLIENDQPTSELLAATLSAHRYAVDTIDNGLAGLEMAIRWNYDLILLDVLLPLLDGIDVCRRLRAQGCQIPILMLAMEASNEDVIIGLDAGADDYFIKTCPISQLLARVRALLRRRNAPVSTPLLTWELLCFDPALARVTYDQKIVALRPKEYSLLELFLRHPQCILSRSAIIDHLWSMEETPVEGVVTNLVKDLRQRLRSAGMITDLIETVYGLGYRLKPPPSGKWQERKNETLMKSKGSTSVSISVAKWNHDEQMDEKHHARIIHRKIERFRVSLEQQSVVLKAVERSLQAGNSSLLQPEVVQPLPNLVDKLERSELVRTSNLETVHQLLERANQETLSVEQLSSLLKELKQKLAPSFIN
jgi:DNA-binding response OmpR family regulator